MWKYINPFFAILGCISLSEAAPLVQLECRQECVIDSKEITAMAGKDIILRFVVDDNLCVLEVKYNGKLIINTFEPHLCRLDVRAVIGRDPRVKFITDLVRVRNTFVYDFKLTNVSLAKDQGSLLSYETDLKYSGGGNVTGTYRMKVLDPSAITTAVPDKVSNVSTVPGIITQLNPTTNIIGQNASLSGTTSPPSISKIPTAGPDKVSKAATVPVNMTQLKDKTTSMVMTSPGKPTRRPATSPAFNTTDDNNGTIVVIQGSKKLRNDEYPYATIIGIVLGAIIVIILIVTVVVAIRCRGARKPRYQYGDEEDETAYNEALIFKDDSTKPLTGTMNGSADYPQAFADREHGDTHKPETKTNGTAGYQPVCNGDSIQEYDADIKPLCNGDSHHVEGKPNGFLESEVYAEIEQGGLGQPLLVYAAADEVEEDRPRFASLNNQPHLSVVVEQPEMSQSNSDSALPCDLSLGEDNNEPPKYIALIKNKPPSDVIEPPSDPVKPSSDLTEPPSDRMRPPSDRIEPPNNTRPPSDHIEPPDCIIPQSDHIEPSSDHSESLLDYYCPQSDLMESLSDYITPRPHNVESPSDDARLSPVNIESPTIIIEPPSDDIKPQVNCIQPPLECIDPSSDFIEPQPDDMDIPLNSVEPLSDVTESISDSNETPSYSIEPPTDIVEQRDKNDLSSDCIIPPSDGIDPLSHTIKSQADSIVSISDPPSNQSETSS